MEPEVEVCYLGHDNAIRIILKEDGTPIDTSSLTKVTLTVGSKTISSINGGSDSIRWNGGAGWLPGEIRLKLGKVEGLSAGVYEAPLVIYDPTNTNGVVWRDVPLVLKSEVEIPTP